MTEARTPDGKFAPHNAYGRLSAREYEVLRLTAGGHSGEEISKRMGNHKKTAGNYLDRIGQKDPLYVTSGMKAVVMKFIEDGISRDSLEYIPPSGNIEPVTLREEQIINGIRQGKTQQELADELGGGTTRRQVSKYLTEIKRKLGGVQTDYQLIAQIAYLKKNGMWQELNADEGRKQSE